MKKLSIIKIGGNVIDSHEKLNAFLKDFAEIDGHKILIHGGGKIATELAEKMGVEQQMVNGRRITDAETLDVVTMVYAGLINKNLVAKLQTYGQNYIGVSGVDLNLIKTKKRAIKDYDFGFVGDITTDSISTDKLNLFIKKNITPIFCAITHNGHGQLLNTNADTLASAIAVAMADFYEVNLYFCFEKKGVLSNSDDEDSVIENITPPIFEELKNQNIINKGMIPKLENAFSAINSGVGNVFILQEKYLLECINQNQNHGTRVSN